MQVAGLTSGVVAIEASLYAHTCALTEAGGVKCWGDNRAAQLGDGTRENRRIPVDVAGLTSGVAAISAGASHTCALTDAGGVKCWGHNFHGEIGDGTTKNRRTPVDVPGLMDGVAAISAGWARTCALTDAGGVKCWGQSFTSLDRLTPVDVPGLASGVAAISAGKDQACAVLESGGVKCWGGNDSGQLGDGTTRERATPVDVTGLTSGVAAISAGLDHTCALTQAGGAYCWGDNFRGQLGDGSITTRLTPVGVSGLGSGLAETSAGYLHTCALTDAGQAKCWGANHFGQMGNGTRSIYRTPVDVAGLGSGVVDISAGFDHACAVTDAGQAKCWGANDWGQVGDGTRDSRNAPVRVVSLRSGVVAISSGYTHTCALTDAGRVECWGRNEWGELGDGRTRNRVTPVDVSGLQSVAAISAGSLHACALTDAGGVVCWGRNSSGQLGDGTTADRSTPVQVPGLSTGVVAIAAEYEETCALLETGRVKCWGGGTRLTPIRVARLKPAVSVTVGGAHTCAITEAGRAKCWGANLYGQLGNGSKETQTIPGTVSGLRSGVAAISAGRRHTCAITDGGRAKCWGDNGRAELGDGTLRNRLVPVRVSGLASGVATISATAELTCALTVTGGAKCWGYYYSGQLGDGSLAWEPVDVIGYP